MFQSRSVSVIVITLLYSAALHAAQTASCTFSTFAAPTGYSFSEVNGVSDDGTVVGQLVDNKTLQFVAFSRSSSGAFTVYSAPKSSTTWLYGSSASGVNAGSYENSGYPGHMHGFTLQGSEFTEVNYPKAANTWLFDVSQVGNASGSYSASATVTKGFLLVNGKYTTIAYPNALITNAWAVNDNGEVVGSYASGAVSNGFAWQNGKFTTINDPGKAYGTALSGVNNSGVIVGNRLAADISFGFIYENGVFENIVYPGAKYAVVGGINNNGLISGQIYLTASNSVGYTAVCK
ncbi:MAG TPA: hypothetical protein VK828_01650 [Terriglobales bacterium]|jgi:hypothetical protein|nr:hypothetical protein [Terriglobales bacterium]